MKTLMTILFCTAISFGAFAQQVQPTKEAKEKYAQMIVVYNQRKAEYVQLQMRMSSVSRQAAAIRKDEPFAKTKLEALRRNSRPLAKAIAERKAELDKMRSYMNAFATANGLLGVQ